LKKGDGYHLDLAVLGGIMFFLLISIYELLCCVLYLYENLRLTLYLKPCSHNGAMFMLWLAMDASLNGSIIESRSEPGNNIQVHSHKVQGLTFDENVFVILVIPQQDLFDFLNFVQSLCLQPVAITQSHPRRESLQSKKTVLPAC
jgi:hypothetical protein